MAIDSAFIQAKIVDIIANIISGSVVVALAYVAWSAKDRAAYAQSRKRVLAARAARLSMFQAELETIVSFTSQCTMASSALDQFATYQQWLVANNLQSWKQNRLIVQTWGQTTGSAVDIRKGQVSVASDVVADLIADMKRTEFPTPEDDDFRWSSHHLEAPVT